MAKKKLSLRILAVLLTVTMVIGVLPMSIFAAGDNGGAKPTVTWEKVENDPERVANHLRNPAEESGKAALQGYGRSPRIRGSERQVHFGKGLLHG